MKSLYVPPLSIPDFMTKKLPVVKVRSFPETNRLKLLLP